MVFRLSLFETEMRSLLSGLRQAGLAFVAGALVSQAAAQEGPAYGTQIDVAPDQGRQQDVEAGKPVLFVYSNSPESVAVLDPIGFQATVDSVEDQGCRVHQRQIDGDFKSVRVMTNGKRHATTDLIDLGGWTIDKCMD